MTGDSLAEFPEGRSKHGVHVETRVRDILIMRLPVRGRLLILLLFTD